MGAGKRLRETYPDVKIICVEPYQNSKIQGLRNLKDFVPPIFDHSLLNSIVNVSDDDAFSMSRLLAREEGLFVGISSGAAMFEALNQAGNLRSGTIVTILPDSGDKYISTELFE